MNGVSPVAREAVDPFTLEIPLDGVVTGMYICRLTVRTEGGIDQSVIPFAVVR